MAAKEFSDKFEELSKDFKFELTEEMKEGASTVDALEDNTQELAFAKGFYRGYKEAVERAVRWLTIYQGKACDYLREESIEGFKQEMEE